MILTVTLNTALDKTYQFGELMLGAAHRAEETHALAGGKDLNVARRGRCRVAVVAAGLTAGSTGQQIERDLEVAGVDTAIHRVEGESRQTVTVVSRCGDAWLEIDEQGPGLSPKSRRSFLDLMEAHLHRASIVVLSGSLPLGTPVDAYRHLTELSHGHGAQVVLDAASPGFEDGVDVMLELLVPPMVQQLETCGGSETRYDDTLRPDLVLRAMEEIAGAGVRPRWWKVEGYRGVAVEGRIAQIGAQISSSGCLVLGRGADPARVEEWLRAARSRVASLGSLSDERSGPRRWAISLLSGSTTRRRSHGSHPATLPSPRRSVMLSE
jgi:fructose-1-phosphate kinase PfkB-like protein